MPPVGCEGRVRRFLRFRSAMKSFREGIPSPVLPSPASASGLFGRGGCPSPGGFLASSIGHGGNDDPSGVQVLLSMPRQYGPELLARCGSVSDMSGRWPEHGWTPACSGRKNCSKRTRRAEGISAWIVGRYSFRNRFRHIPRIETEERKLMVSRIENDREPRHAALSAFHAGTRALAGTRSARPVENHSDCAFIRQRFVQPLPAVQSGTVQAVPNEPAATQNPGFLW